MPPDRPFGCVRRFRCEGDDARIGWRALAGIWSRSIHYEKTTVLKLATVALAVAREGIDAECSAQHLLEKGASRWGDMGSLAAVSWPPAYSLRHASVRGLIGCSN